MKEGALLASVRLDQKDGYAETSARGAMKWGAEIAPEIDLAQPVDVAILAKNFRANAAMPFVQGTITELDGRLDADAKFHIHPGGKDSTMSGALTIREGIFEMPPIGERFHGLQGRVVMRPWGTIRLENFSAEGLTGKVTASAEAVLKGLALQSATAKVHITQGQALPLVFDGVAIGKAYGTITTRAQMAKDGKRLDVDVDIPSFHLELPQSTGHSVQPLEPEETVRIGLHSRWHVRRRADVEAAGLARRQGRGPRGRRRHAGVEQGDLRAHERRYHHARRHVRGRQSPPRTRRAALEEGVGAHRLQARCPVARRQPRSDRADDRRALRPYLEPLCRDRGSRQLRAERGVAVSLLRAGGRTASVSRADHRAGAPRHPALRRQQSRDRQDAAAKSASTAPGGGRETWC